jgi:hypothetical protein
MTGIGASRPLRRIPAIVSFLNPQPPLSLVGGNRSSCPNPAIARARLRKRLAEDFPIAAGDSTRRGTLRELALMPVN